MLKLPTIRTSACCAGELLFFSGGRAHESSPVVRSNRVAYAEQYVYVTVILANQNAMHFLGVGLYKCIFINTIWCRLTPILEFPLDAAHNTCFVNIHHGSWENTTKRSFI